MSTPYDDSFKALVRDDPLAFVRLSFPKAQFVRARREKLKEWKLEVDALLEITNDAEDIIAARFPRLARLATGILSTIDSPAVLRSLIIKMSTAQTSREAKEQLLAIVDEEDEEQGEE